MTTLAATPTVDGVSLVVDPATAVVSRLDANGVRVVRRVAGSTTFVDYEAPLRGTVRYVAIDPDGNSATATAVAITDGKPQLRQVFAPAVAVRPVVATLSSSSSLTATEHTIIGRADTVFTTYGVGKRRGSITYACAEWADTLELRRLYAAGVPALLRLPEYAAIDCYHIGTMRSDTQEDTRTEDGWTTVVDFAEVEPSSLAVIAGWTLGDVASSYPSLGVAALAYATLGDLDANRLVSTA